MSSSSEIVDLKRRAVALKRDGDVKGAIQLLRQAKQLEQQAQKQEEHVQTSDSQNKRDNHESNEQEQVGESPIQEQSKQQVIKTANEETGNNDISEEPLEDDLVDLLQEDGPITYSEEEMQDCEMMTEFKLGGMPVPSNDDYKAKILSTKKKALALKNSGNLSGAKKQLLCAKQLETVRIALSHMNEGLGLRIHNDNDGWLEELSEPDSALVGNLLNKNTPMVLEMEDLDTMSPEELSDAVEMGMELPAVEDILAAANEKKSQALQFKQQGDLEGARTALLAYKELQAVASKIESLNQHRNDEGDTTSDEVTMEALEALVEETSGAPERKKQQPKKAPARSAEELKQEAVRLRNENKIKEATEVLKLYKAALKREAEAAEKKRGEEIVESIRKEIVLAEQQRRFFQFYERFVDEEVGGAQVACWNDYIDNCANATKLVVNKGPKSVTMSRTMNSGALYIQDEKLVHFVERGVDESDERLEVAILDVKNIHDNKAFRKLLPKGKEEGTKSIPSHFVKVDVTVQIPPSEEERDKSVEFVFESSAESDLTYQYNSSQFVKVPRGDSKFANTVRRRMERRRIQIGVYHVPHVIKRKGWFGGGSGGQAPSNENTPTLLGKVILELKDLLKRNCIVGDFPLMSSTRPAGGTLGIVVRTGVPFDTEQFESIIPDTGLEKYNAMTFSLSKQHS